MMEVTWQNPTNPPDAKDYIFRDGRRFVKPYHFEFIAHVKKRWAGKTIVDLFSDEFRGRPYDYYVDAVRSGRIQVGGQRIDPSYVVRCSQRISHFVHRHEPPVTDLDVLVLHKDSDVVTVCKPATIPVHTCGQYRKNTVVGILEADHFISPIFPIHRLDRLVSGLLIFARTANKAEYFRQQIESGLLQKEYIAKVLGVFPDGEQVVTANIDHDAREGRSSAVDCDELSSEQSKGKTACTKFTRVSTDGVHSIVLCRPITGRTHQIRVHLKYTGHPIANDMMYISDTFAPRSASGTGADRAALLGSTLVPPKSVLFVDLHPEEEFTIDPMCTNCPNLAPKGYEMIEEGLWLHCVKYTGPGWSYSCPLPAHDLTLSKVISHLLRLD